MASLDFITGFGWGVDTQIVGEDDGYTQPQVVVAISIDPNTIRVQFDQEMLQEPLAGTVLNPDSFDVVENLSGDRLYVLEVRAYSAKEVELVTAHQNGVTYDLTVTDVLSVWGQPIDASANTDSFLGTPQPYPPATSMYSLYGIETGIQAAEQPDFEPDLTPPYLDNQDPFSGETGVSRTKIVEFDLLDTETGVDLDTVVVEVAYSTAYTGATDAFSPPYDGGGSSITPTIVDGYDGYHLAIQKTSEWPWDTLIPVRVVARDVTGNLLDTTYEFRTLPDPSAPFLVLLSPAEDTEQNPKDGYVSFAVVDKEGTLSGASIRIDINGSSVYDGAFPGVFQPPFDDAYSSVTEGVFDGYDGYGFVLARTDDFPSYQLVEVRVRAEDISSNLLDRTYSFRIEDYEPPILTNLDPVPGTEDVDENTLVRVDIYDAGSGVDISTLLVHIDGHLAYDGYGFLPPFDGGSSEVTSDIIDGYDGYHLIVEATNAYPSARRIYVEIEVEDNEGN